MEIDGQDGGKQCDRKTNANSSTLARRGGGPRTALGKERTRYNALKHGLFSAAVVLKSESAAEFDVLLHGLREYFQPVGTFEDITVESIAARLWRRRRLFVAESAEIQAATAFIEWDESERHLVEAGRISQVYCNGGLVRKIANPEALDRCLEILETLRTQIKQGGFSDDDERLLAILYGDFDPKHWERTPLSIYVRLSKLAFCRSDAGVLSKEEELSRAERVQEFLATLTSEIGRIQKFKEQQALITRERTKVESLRRNLPDGPQFDRLSGYEARLDRGLERNLRQLERAQRMRRGQPQSPSIDIDISSG